MNDQQNPKNLGDGIKRLLPLSVDAHNQVTVEKPSDGALSRQPPAPCPQEFYRRNGNMTNSDGPFVLPPLPRGLTFVVTSCLMQMLTTTGLCLGLLSEDPQAHIAKLG